MELKMTLLIAKLCLACHCTTMSFAQEGGLGTIAGIPIQYQAPKHMSESEWEIEKIQCILIQRTILYPIGFESISTSTQRSSKEKQHL
ncbi:hypothetical protein CDAR_574341 [Caerostris darwini]|uniref:Secreted protein n=1 Tax=Caerostris darwini TaxID=1538125 RepID=A0AAV4S2N5_9ARAC|nr:hypothetical protein CDAR_574341 [Caerostris darwini]